jgi:hypothetical protein
LGFLADKDKPDFSFEDAQPLASIDAAPTLIFFKNSRLFIDTAPQK